jgi:hypothetical protein
MIPGELTNYPKIFNRTSWGCVEGRPITENIINNRNLFVHDYKINKLITNTNNLKKISVYESTLANHPRYRKFCDHSELYKTIDGRYILVMSSGFGTREEEEDFCDNIGFIKINPLYSESATTFVKDLTNLKKSQIYF